MAGGRDDHDAFGACAADEASLVILGNLIRDNEVNALQLLLYWGKYRGGHLDRLFAISWNIDITLFIK